MYSPAVQTFYALAHSRKHTWRSCVAILNMVRAERRKNSRAIVTLSNQKVQADGLNSQTIKETRTYLCTKTFAPARSMTGFEGWTLPIKSLCARRKEETCFEFAERCFTAYSTCRYCEYEISQYFDSDEHRPWGVPRISNLQFFS